MVFLLFVLAGLTGPFGGGNDQGILSIIKKCRILKYSLSCVAALCGIFKFYNLVDKLKDISIFERESTYDKIKRKKYKWGTFS